MAALFHSLAYRARWARRSFLCRYRNWFPLSPEESTRALVAMHRRQGEDFHARETAPAGQTLEEARRLEVEARLALLSGSYQSALEIGCENGWFGRLLVDRGLSRRATGVDLRAEELRGWARPGTPLLAATAENLPLKSARFDLIAAFHVLEHIRDPARLRAELARLAAPGAHVVLAVPLGYDTDPCHRWHFMSARGWKGFLRKRFGLELVKGGIHRGAADEFLGLFRWP